MPIYDVIAMRFKSGLHLAQGKENNFDKSQEVLHSDTLKSAIFVSWLQLNGSQILGVNKEEQKENGIAFFKSFKISSCFPFYLKKKAKEPLFFLPKPINSEFINRLAVSGVPNAQQGKYLKRIQYLEKSLLLKLIEGTVSIPSSNLTKDGKFASLNQNLEEVKIFDSSPRQHVSVPRIPTQDANPYVVDRIYFDQNAGLYFLLEADKEEIKERIRNILDYLSDTGLGTDKNIGGGQFELVCDKNLTIELPTTGQFQMALSLYCPNVDAESVEIDDLSQSAYKIVRRGGYIANPTDSRHMSIRKRAVYMFKEGSVFPALYNRSGTLVNLQPDNNILMKNGIKPINHPIWRDGQALFLGL